MASNNKKIMGMDQDKFSMFLSKYGITLVLLVMMLFSTGRNARRRDSYAEIYEWERRLERESFEEEEEE